MHISDQITPFFAKSLLSQKQLRAIGLLPREKAEKDDEDDLQEDQCWDVNGHAPRVPRLQHLSHLSQPHPGALFLGFFPAGGFLTPRSV